MPRDGDRPNAPRPGLGGLTPLRALVLGLLGLATVSLFLAWLTYEIVDQGELLPWDVGFVYEVELFDRFTVYADGEAREAPDAVNGLLLGALAAVALFSSLLLARLRRADGRTVRCFDVLGLGAGYLALDELLGLHETVGYNLPWLADLPGISRPDDAIILAYVVPAGLFVFIFRDLLLSSRRAARLFALGLALFVSATVLDAAGVVAEELVEPFSTMALVTGLVVLALEKLTGEPARAPGESRS